MTAAILGIGQTRFSRESGVSDTDLAIEAIGGALHDAGIDLDDVNGLATYDLEHSDPMYLCQVLGLGPLSWFSLTPWGGGLPCGVLQDAVLAVEAGVADVVVAYRAGNMRSGDRVREMPESLRRVFQWTAPFGILMASEMFSLWGHRYMYERGLTNEDLAVVSVTQRAYAATNPAAYFFERPLTIEEHQESRWVIEPVLRVPDCCLETDGGVAFVITNHEKARGETSTGEGHPVYIRAAARGMAPHTQQMTNYYHLEGDRLPDLRVVADQLWQQSGLGPKDMQVANVYDSFAPYVPMILEELGYSERGRGLDFIGDGGTGLNGPLPLNTNGGQLAEAYIHGFNGIAEVVRQIRGTAANQVSGVVNGLALGSSTMPTSGLVLSSESG